MTDSVTVIPSMEQRLADLEQAVLVMNTTLSNMLELLQVIRGQVEPTITALSNSPIGKMMGI